MMKKNLFFFFIFLGIFFYAQNFTTGKQTITINSRLVDVITPSDYDTRKEYPIIFFLHGLNGDRSSLQLAVPNIGSIITKLQIIGVFPEGSKIPLQNGRTWNSFLSTQLLNFPDDVQFIKDIKSSISIHHAGFNNDKVFGLGFSNGGSMLLKIAKESYNIFSAMTIGSISEEDNSNGDIPMSATKTPMLFFHGKEDTVIPFNGGSGAFGPIASFRSVPATVNQWALHNELNVKDPQIIKYEALSDGKFSNFYVNEFTDISRRGKSIYFFVVPGAQHELGINGFSAENIFYTSLKFFKNTGCYGLSRQTCIDAGKWNN